MSIRRSKEHESRADDSGIFGRLPGFPAKLLIRSWLKILLAIGILFSISLTLNCIGITWGQPGGNPWHPDSIAGMRTVRQMPNLLGEWQSKYPRLHFMVNAAFYKPFLSYWRQNPVVAPVDEGRRVGKVVLNMERISTLIMVSRIISALMGAGAVVTVFLTARLLFNDNVAAFFSGLALAFSMLFVCYSHLGNLDIPCTFWFAWALYWAVKATYIGKWRHFVFLGLFCSLAVCTKDPAVGYVVGLGVAVWLAMIGKARDAGEPFKKALTAVFSIKVLIAVVVAVFCFALLNDILTTPDAFLRRMGHWLGGAGTTAYQHGFKGQLHLLQKTFKNLYYALGWPLLLAVTISLVYCVMKFRWKSVFAVIPLIAFYLIVIVNIHFSYPRFFLQAFPALVLLVGKASADWLRWRRLPIVVKVFPLVFVYILSLLYCLGLDLELVGDTRYRAEQWLASHVSHDDCVVALTGSAYAPRIQMLGCKYIFWHYRPQNEELLRKIRPYANYLVLSEKEFEITETFDQDFLRALLEGKRGYKQVAHFSNKYLYPRKTIFGFPGWPVRRLRMYSPDTIILKREDSFRYQ